MTFLIYEIKFTVGKSRDGFHCGEEERSLGETRHFGGNSPKRCIEKKHCPGMTVDKHWMAAIRTAKPDLNSEHS